MGYSANPSKIIVKFFLNKTSIINIQLFFEITKKLKLFFKDFSHKPANGCYSEAKQTKKNETL